MAQSAGRMDDLNFQLLSKNQRTGSFSGKTAHYLFSVLTFLDAHTDTDVVWMTGVCIRRNLEPKQLPCLTEHDRKIFTNQMIFWAQKTNTTNLLALHLQFKTLK